MTGERTGPSLPLRIAADHPALAGHFPGNPLVPGVVLLDEVIHLFTATRVFTGAPAGTFCQLEAVKFHHTVLPGEALELQLRPRTAAAQQAREAGEACSFELWSPGTAASAARLVMSGVIVT